MAAAPSRPAAYHLKMRRGGVGRQFDYWGPPGLAREVEMLFSTVESDALRLLADLQDHWPLTKRDDRAALGQFLAIHIVRMPSFGGYLRQLGKRRPGRCLLRVRPNTTSTNSR
jgi:hypothetical protein